MTGAEDSERNVVRALELADGYLEEAQDILWYTATNMETSENGNTVEGLTEDIWDIQHRLDDLKRELEE